MTPPPATDRRVVALVAAPCVLVALLELLVVTGTFCADATVASRARGHGCYRRVGLLCSIAIGRRGTVATGGGFILLGCYRQALFQTPLHD